MAQNNYVYSLVAALTFENNFLFIKFTVEKNDPQSIDQS